MWALLRIQGFDQQYPVFLAPGSLRNSLTQAINMLTSRRLVPPLAQINGANLTYRDNDVYAVGPCNLETLIVGESILEVSEFDVTCTWAAVVPPADAAALRNALQAFRTVDLAHRTQLCPVLARMMAETAAQRIVPPPVPPPPRTVRVFFSSAGQEGFNAGDASYMESLVRALSGLGITACRLVGMRDPIPLDRAAAVAAGQLRQLNYTNPGTALARTRAFLLDHANAHPHDLIVLHIQTRNAQSGGWFTGDFIDDLHTHPRIRVVTTVHEIKFNIAQGPNPEANVEWLLNEHCLPARRVVFLNDHDMRQAIRRRDALANKTTHIPVALTVPGTNIDPAAVLIRPPNVAVFGMIRPGKGCDEALDLAQLIRDNHLAWRVLLIGNPHAPAELFQITTRIYGAAFFGRPAIAAQLHLWNAYQGHHHDTASLRTYLGHCDAERTAMILAGHGAHFLPVDLHVDIPDAQLAPLFAQCKYAYKEDTKGLGDNASSIVACMSYGCITFTHLGSLTPHEFRSGNKVVSVADTRKLSSPHIQLLGATNVPGVNLRATVQYVGEYTASVVTPGIKNHPCTPAWVFAEMQAREAEVGQISNFATVTAMRNAIANRFSPALIAAQHRSLYESL